MNPKKASLAPLDVEYYLREQPVCRFSLDFGPSSRLKLHHPQHLPAVVEGLVGGDH